jgi:hypothetical protein
MAVPALRIVLCATLASLMVLGRPVEAQELARTARITLDNDFLNVWQPPRERADHNYTHGLRLTWDLARAPEFARRLVCTSGACGTTLEIGQEIYTSTLDWFWYVEGERPYAGWLYGRVDVRGGDRATLRRLGLTVGVTGPPSLGEAAHTAVHETFADFKPRVGWVDQLPTEIAFAALASHSWRLVPNGAAARFVDVVPTVAGTLGTLRTSAEAGMRVRLGAPLTHPWLVCVRRPPGRSGRSRHVPEWHAVQRLTPHRSPAGVRRGGRRTRREDGPRGARVSRRAAQSPVCRLTVVRYVQFRGARVGYPVVFAPIALQRHGWRRAALRRSQ